MKFDLNLTVVYIQYNQHIISISSNILDMHYFIASEAYRDFINEYGEFSAHKNEIREEQIFKPDFTNTIISHDYSSSGSTLMNDIVSALELFEVEGESIFRIINEIRSHFCAAGSNMLLSTIQIFNKVFSRTIEIDNEICSVTKQSSLVIDEDHMFAKS